MKRVFFTCFLAFFAVSALGQENQTPTTEKGLKGKTGEVVTFKTLAKNASGEAHEAKNLVIKNREEWEKLWEALNQNVAEKPALPEVDFNTRMIVAIFAGDKPNPGYDIAVLETFTVGKKGMRITYQVTKPGGACVYPAVISQPYHIIETDKVKHVSFTFFQDVKECKNR